MIKTVQVAVEKAPAENNSGALRRFTKRVQESGILRKVRSQRYKGRARSKFVVKKSTLKMLDRKKEMLRLIKLGKAPETGR